MLSDEIQKLKFCMMRAKGPETRYDDYGGYWYATL
jgi:hypothetical protein